MKLNNILKYESVVSYHGYRKNPPWEAGGRLVFEMPYKRGDAISRLERELLAKTTGGSPDNHYGWTVLVDGKPFRLHFSDGWLSAYAMPV